MREEKEKTIYKMNHKWNYQPPSQEQTEAAKALAKETGINPVLCKLLLERGITSAADCRAGYERSESKINVLFRFCRYAWRLGEPSEDDGTDLESRKSV